MNLETKISLIQKSEAELPSKDFLIFHPPNIESLKWTHCRGQNDVKISKIIESFWVFL